MGCKQSSSINADEEEAEGRNGRDNDQDDGDERGRADFVIETMEDSDAHESDSPPIEVLEPEDNDHHSDDEKKLDSDEKASDAEDES